MTSAAPRGGALECRYRPGHPVAIGAILAPFRRGAGDPTFRRDAAGIWLARHTPAGAGTLLVRAETGTGEVVGQAWGDGGAWLLPRAVGLAKAMEMAFTGEAIDAAEALAAGLVSRVVPHDQLLDAALALAGRIAANPGPTLRLTKKLMREAQVGTLETLLELSANAQALAHKTPEHREAVTAFIDKRAPDFDKVRR